MQGYGREWYDWLGTQTTGEFNMKPGDLIRFKCIPHNPHLGVIIGPEYVVDRTKRYTQYQLGMLQVLKIGGDKPAEIVRIHGNYLELVE